MQHLTREDLARLVDEAPAGAEREHLEACGACAGELAELRTMRTELGRLPEPAPPSELWTAVEARLRREGLVADRPAQPLAWLRPAAAVALFLLGSLTGGAVVALGGGAPAAGGEPAVAADAAARLEAAEAAYLEAMSDFAGTATGADAPDPLSRLVALEGILATTGAALREAPTDPIINNYHLTTLGLRDALLRQMDTAEEERWF